MTIIPLIGFEFSILRNPGWVELEVVWVVVNVIVAVVVLASFAGAKDHVVAIGAGRSSCQIKADQ